MVLGSRRFSSVEGSAEDFCLVVTQRRHLDDTALIVRGNSAEDWLLKHKVLLVPQPTALMQEVTDVACRNRNDKRGINSHFE